MWALVTGAASGLGLAVSERLAQAGYRVLATDVRAAPPSSLASAVEQSNGRYTPLDVAHPESWQSALADLDDPISRLHLNAGIQIAPPEAPMSDYRFESMQIARYRQMMGVNVDGVVFGLHFCLPHMAKGDAIVATASLAGITPYDVDPLYSMSKHAVVGLVRSMVRECAEREVRINALCPGGIDTGIIPEAQRAAAPVDAFMTPEHVAEEVMHLFATEESGKTWTKVRADKPAWIIRAPGDRSA